MPPTPDPTCTRQATHAAARRVLHHAVEYTQNGRSRLGPQNIRIRDVQVVARNPDVEIVFQRQHDGIVD